jgi:endonuclease/exonuclease/phosphatase family metal-dependent hydrolase
MSELRIVSHNAFWFQGAPFGTDRPGSPDPAILAALVEIYRRLRPDVLALQEIQDECTFERLAAALAISGRYCPGGQLAQYGGAIFWRAGSFVADWRSSAVTPRRMWQMVQLRAASSTVRICNMHLPSSRQLGKEVAARARATELLAVLDGTGAPAVVMGDFNEAPGGPVGACFTARGYLDAAVVAGFGDRSTSLGGGRGDQIWIHGSLRGRLAEYGVVEKRVLKPAGRGKESLSDHFPLWVTLKA